MNYFLRLLDNKSNDFLSFICYMNHYLCNFSIDLFEVILTIQRLCLFNFGLESLLNPPPPVVMSTLSCLQLCTHWKRPQWPHCRQKHVQVNCRLWLAGLAVTLPENNISNHIVTASSSQFYYMTNNGKITMPPVQASCLVNNLVVILFYFFTNILS